MSFYGDYKTRKSCITAAFKTWKNPVVTISTEVNGHFWIDVKEVESDENWLEVLFIRQRSDKKWEYKFIAEYQGIQCYDCPVEMLKGIPIVDKDWRGLVKHYSKL